MSRTSTLWKQAATAILVKRGTRLADSQNHGVKFLMLERSAQSKFMPSACVFPGGIVSDVDFSYEWLELLNAWSDKQQLGTSSEANKYGIHTVAQPMGERPPILQQACQKDTSVTSDIAYRLCALRETFEECGVLLFNPLTSSHSSINSNSLKEWRDKVNKNGNEFLTMCKQLSIVPDLSSLHEWTNWLTPTHMNKMHNNLRYDTMFYIACVENAVEAEHDEKEVVSTKWYSPEEMLQNYYHEKILLAPPQIYEVCRFLHSALRDWDSVEQHVRSRAESGCERWLPVRINCTDGIISVLPGDDLYPDNPDVEGSGEVPKIKDSLKQSRHKCENLHRIEIRSIYDCKVACTIQPRFNHVPPVEWVVV